MALFVALCLAVLSWNVAAFERCSSHECGRNSTKRAKSLRGQHPALQEESKISPSTVYPRYAYGAWSHLIRNGVCSQNDIPLELQLSAKNGLTKGKISCALERGSKTYRFPAGIFEIDEQLLVPENTSLIGARAPNDMSRPTESPEWSEQTLFLATRGVTDYFMSYCHVSDMISTRVGFVLSSFVSVMNVGYQGLDTIRPHDNGALCGGGAFETKGCAENNCSVSSVNNAGSDGVGSVHVLIDNVRLNDFYFDEDKASIGATIEGNYNCSTTNFADECCFCKPNGVRSTQIGVWIPQSRNQAGSQNILVRNLVSRSHQADGINLHGNVKDARIENIHIENTGDDTFVVWGADSNPTDITFKNCVAANPGRMRPNWYGNCVATYGLGSVVFSNMTCVSPTLDHPIISPDDGFPKIDTSMFVFYTSFGAQYPSSNRVYINGWSFKDSEGNEYTPSSGSMSKLIPRKMVWSYSVTGISAPFYVPPSSDFNQRVNVHASRRADEFTKAIK